VRAHPTLEQEIRAALAVLYANDADAIQAWFLRPQGCLEGRVPARMIAIGEGAQVLATLQATNDGVFL
jgi:hypothetical protein